MRSLAYSRIVQEGCLKWLTPFWGSTCKVKQTSGSILWVGLTSAKLILSLLSPFSTRCTGFSTVPCGPFVTFLNFKFPARSKLWIWCRQKHLKGHWLSQDRLRKMSQMVTCQVRKTSGKRNFHDQKQIIHESRIPREINHASHAFRYSWITFPFNNFHASRTNFSPYHTSRINPLLTS